MVIDLDFWGVSRYSEISPPPLEIVEIFEKVEMLALKKISGSYTLQSPNCTKKTVVNVFLGCTKAFWNCCSIVSNNQNTKTDSFAS